MIEIRLKNLSEWDPDEEIIIRDFPFTLGRHPECNGQVLHPLISRQHCRFYLRGDEVWVQDLESLNGTSLNGELISTPRRVEDGDVLGLPCYHYSVSLEREGATC